MRRPCPSLLPAALFSDACESHTVRAVSAKGGRVRWIKSHVPDRAFTLVGQTKGTQVKIEAILCYWMVVRAVEEIMGLENWGRAGVFGFFVCLFSVQYE